MSISADNNRLYTENGKGITLDEIAACLKDYRVTALGRDLGLLATSPNINRDAKYKPVDNPTLGDLYADVPLGYRGTKGDCNIDYLVYNMTDIMGGFSTDTTTAKLPFFYDLVAARTKDHTYRTISNATPKRMLDFDGYNHNASTLWNVVYPTYAGGRPTFAFSQIKIGAYEYADLISNNHPTELTLIDLMQGLRGSGESTLVTYDENNAITTDVKDGDSYGYIGVFVIADTNHPTGWNVMFASKSVGSVLGDNINSFTPEDGADNGASISSSVVDALLAPNMTARVVPVICNVNTGGKWKAMQLGRFPNFRAIPLPMSKTWYKDYDLAMKFQDAFTATTNSYPETWNRGSGRFYVYTAAGSSASGGITTIIKPASATLGVLSNLKYAIYKGSSAIPTNKIGEGTLTITSAEISAGKKSINVADWNGGSGSIFESSTGYSYGLINAFSYYNCTDFFIQFAVDLPASSKWVSYVAGWDFNSGILITKNTSTNYPL